MEVSGELITVVTVVGGAALLIPHSTHSININSSVEWKFVSLGVSSTYRMSIPRDINKERDVSR